jgi:hypothetical protein
MGGGADISSFSGKKPEIRRKLSRNIDKMKNKDLPSELLFKKR